MKSEASEARNTADHVLGLAAALHRLPADGKLERLITSLLGDTSF